MRKHGKLSFVYPRNIKEFKELVKRCPCVWKRWFLRIGKTGLSAEKPFGARERTNNKLNPHTSNYHSSYYHCHLLIIIIIIIIIVVVVVVVVVFVIIVSLTIM